MNDLYSFSTLNIDCELYLYKKLNQTKKETFITDDTSLGLLLHNYLKEKDLQSVIDLLGYEIMPQRNLGIIWEEGKREVVIKNSEKGIYGILDLIYSNNEEIYICDWKSATTYRSEFDNQLKFYFNLLPENEIKEKKLRGIIYLIRKDEKIQKEFSINEINEFYKKWIEKRIKRINDMIESIHSQEKDKFFTFISSFCKYCPYLISCPECPSKFPSSQDEALLMVESILQLEEKLKVLKENLKVYVERNGKIKDIQYEADFYPTYSYDVEKEKLFSYLIDNKINPFEFFNISKQNIDKIQKKIIDISAFIQESIGQVRFDIKKIQEEE